MSFRTEFPPRNLVSKPVPREEQDAKKSRKTPKMADTPPMRHSPKRENRCQAPSWIRSEEGTIEKTNIGGIGQIATKKPLPDKTGKGQMRQG